MKTESAATASTGLRTRTACRGSMAVCLLAGDITMDTERHTALALAGALRSEPAVLAIDLAAVEMFSCSGLNQLLNARRRAEAQGTRMVLIAPSRLVRRVLQLTDTADLFPVADTLSLSFYLQ